MIFFKKKAKLLEPGTPAPDFQVQDHHGESLRKADLAGRRVLMWFYPKADTRGCTIEGKGFCAGAAELADDLVVLGVSFDTVAENRAFAEKYAFPYRLLCDTDRTLSLAYGATVSAKAKYPDRISYVIDRDGMIEWAEKVSDIEAHVPAALARLKGA